MKILCEHKIFHFYISDIYKLKNYRLFALFSVQRRNFELVPQDGRFDVMFKVSIAHTKILLFPLCIYIYIYIYILTLCFPLENVHFLSSCSGEAKYSNMSYYANLQLS